MCKAQLLNVLNLKSFSSSQERNFRGYKCFMCWAWPPRTGGFMRIRDLPEARSEAAPYSENSERALPNT